ncbi:hypothetical protein BGZ82_001744 [Podila clonocystis]|nr:hypothetical protein BGZ82_001744 [Podila clonocystis]
MHFKSMLLLCGLLSFAAANPIPGCSASGQKQVCCSGLLACLIQVAGSNCNNKAYCCTTSAPVGSLVNVALLNCDNGVTLCSIENPLRPPRVHSRVLDVSAERHCGRNVDFGFFLGKKFLSGIGFEPRNIFTGLNGLPDITFVISIENIPDAASKKQTISFKVNANSKSNVNVKMGDFVFNAESSIGVIGTTTFVALSPNQGDNIVTAVTVVGFTLPGAADFVSGLEIADGTLAFTGFFGG